MNKEDFLKKLTDELTHIPPVEIVKAIGYYKESIEDRVDDGMTEEEAVRSLGSFEEIIKNIEDEVSLGSVVKDKVKRRVEQDNSSGNNKLLLVVLAIVTFPIWGMACLVGVSLVFAFYVAIWGLFIAVLGTYFSAFVAGGILLFVGIFRAISLDILTGVAYIGVGLIFIGVTIAFMKPIFWLVRKWLQINALPFIKLKKWIMKRG